MSIRSITPLLNSLTVGSKWAVVPVEQRKKLVVRKKDDGTWEGWWVDYANEVVEGKDDVEVIGKLCIIKCGQVGIYIEWCDKNDMVV
jgi:hypothetical protein